MQSGFCLCFSVPPNIMLMLERPHSCCLLPPTLVNNLTCSWVPVDVTQRHCDVAPLPSCSFCVCSRSSCLSWVFFFGPREVAAGKRVKPPASHAGSDPTVPLRWAPTANRPGDELGPRECANYMAVTNSGGGGGFGVEGWKTKSPLLLRLWLVITASLYMGTSLFKA